MAGPWEDYAKPSETESEGPWNDYKAEAKPAPVFKTEGTLDEQLGIISEKYKVSPSVLKGYARDIGSLEAAESPLGKGMAGLKGVAESLTFGIPTKLAKKTIGLFQPEYEKALDEVSELVEQRKSIGQQAVEFGAGMAIPTAGIAKAAGLGQKVLTGVKAGATTGALAGFGASKKGEEISGTTTGAAIGAPLGIAAPLIGAGFQKYGEIAKEAGEESLTKMFGLGRTQKQREELLKAGKTPVEATMEAIKKIGGINKSDKTFADVMERISSRKQKYGEMIGENVKMADDDKIVLNDLLKGFKSGDFMRKDVSPLTTLPSKERLKDIPDSFFKNVNQDLGDELLKYARQLGDTPAERTLARKLEKEAARFTKKSLKGDMSLRELQTMKVALDKQINYEARKNLDNNFTKNLRDAVNSVTERQLGEIQKVDNFIESRFAGLEFQGKETPPYKILEEFRDAKREYGQYAKILKAAEKAQAARLKGEPSTEGFIEPSTLYGSLVGLLTLDPVTGIAVKFITGGVDNFWKKVKNGEISPIAAKRLIDSGAKAIQRGETAEEAVQRFMRESTKEGID